MKGLLILLAFCLAYSAWGFEVTYPVKNFKYISDMDLNEEVRGSDKYVVMVFSWNECLQHTTVYNSCFYFEKRLDYFVPSFSSNVKVVGINAYSENFQAVSEFLITKTPTIIIFKNNQILKRIESDYAWPDLARGRLAWQDELLMATINEIKKIR